MVLWLIGMSRSGKTTLGREIYRRLKANYPHTVYLDGDEVRAVFGNDVGHTVEDRWRNAQRLTGLCQLLNQQGIHVVCSVLSIFHESQRWNRQHLKDYFEVYLDVPFDVLMQRDTQGLYRAALAGTQRHVVGVDIEFPPPCQPDLVIRNDGALEALLAQADAVIQRLSGLEPVEAEKGLT